MKFSSLIGQRGARAARRNRPAVRLSFETCEDRSVPSGVDVVSGDPNDWPMFNHDAAGTRYNQAEHVLSPSTVGDLGIKWSYPTAGPIAGTPAVVNDCIYTADATGQVYALDRDGNLIWQTTLDIGFTLSTVKVNASALVTNRTVIIGDQSGRVHGLDVDTGAVKWMTIPDSHPFAAIWGSATMVGNNVAIGVSSNDWVAPAVIPGYQPTFRGSVVLLDPETGGVIWKTYTISDADSAAGATGAAVWCTPTYDRASNTLFVGTSNNYEQPTTSSSDAIFAIDATDGHVKWVNQRTEDDDWNYALGDSSEEHPDFDIGDSPQVYKINGRTVVGFGQKSGFFHVLDAETGEEVSAPIQVAPSGTVGGLFVDSAYADGVNFTNGTDWPAPLFGTDPPNKGIIAAIAADGSEELWRFETPGSPNLSGVAVANGVVYFQSLFGTFYALDAQTGEPLAQVLTGGLSSGPAISRGQIYLGTGDAAFTFLSAQPLAPASIMALGLPDKHELSAASIGSGYNVRDLVVRQARPLLKEALRRWSLAGADVSSLGTIDIRIADLGGTTLGRVDGNTIWLDDDAAGWGWFVDKSPRNDAEFRKAGNQGERNRMDLLTVLMHETGHMLGKGHESQGLMSETLAVGTRHTLVAHSSVNGPAGVEMLFSDSSTSKRRW